MSRNPNHPKAGTSLFIEPLRSRAEVAAVRATLSSPRDQALLDIGINCALKPSELLRLQWGQLRDAKPGDCLIDLGSATHGRSLLLVNEAIAAAARYLLEHTPEAARSDYVFPSRKRAEPLQIPSLNNLVKKWTAEAGLLRDFGGETLRKSFAYIRLFEDGADLLGLMFVFGYRCPLAFLAFLGVDTNAVEPGRGVWTKLSALGLTPRSAIALLQTSL